MTDLQKEAEGYANEAFQLYLETANKFLSREEDKKECIQDFIAGANSNFVKQQILQGKIDVLNNIINKIQLEINYFKKVKHCDNELVKESLLWITKGFRLTILCIERQLKELQNEK